jgi:hypothetical protein
VSHPNVCRVYDIGECDGRLFLSMASMGRPRGVARRIGRRLKIAPSRSLGRALHRRRRMSEASSTATLPK